MLTYKHVRHLLLNREAAGTGKSDRRWCQPEIMKTIKYNITNMYNWYLARRYRTQ